MENPNRWRKLQDIAGNPFLCAEHSYSVHTTSTMGGKGRADILVNSTITECPQE